MRNFILLTISTILSFSIFSFKVADQPTTTLPESSINWMTFEEAAAKMEVEKRKIVVDIYTDWCGWCKHMDKTTFQKDHIAEYINKTFYPVKLNAEQRETITIGEKTYKYIKGNGKERGYHELAMAISMGRLTFPTVVFIDENIRVLQPLPGYKDPESFEMIMTYYGNNHFKQTPWSKYQSNYIPMVEQAKPQLISD